MFWHTVFNGIAVFIRTAFIQEATFVSTKFIDETSFHLITFGSNVRFDHVDLSKVSFWRSDVSQLSLVGCTWAVISEPILWPLPITWPDFMARPRSALKAEIELEKPSVPQAHEEAPTDQSVRVLADHEAEFTLRWTSETYRQLRLNLESNRQEAEAGDFYIGQMEMRRRDKAYPWLQRWFILPLYRVLAMYGESYARPMFWYLFLGILFALAYLWAGFKVSTETVQYSPLSLDFRNLAGFGRDFVRSYVQALSAGGILGANLAGLSGLSLASGSWWVPLVRYANMLVDTFLVAFFVIALRRHFRR